jgi:hypothetical protein
VACHCTTAYDTSTHRPRGKRQSQPDGVLIAGPDLDVLLKAARPLGRLASSGPDLDVLMLLIRRPRRKRQGLSGG